MQRRLKHILLISFIAIFILSCSTRTVDIKNYRVGDIRSVNVGEKIVFVGKDLDEDMRFFPRIKIKDRFLNEKLFAPLKPPYEGIYDEDDHSYMVILDKNELFIVNVDKNGVVTKTTPFFKRGEQIFEPEPIYRSLTKSKLYELTYSGMYGKYISLIFKEYYINVEDIGRPISELKPSYSEKVFYDIKDDDETIYKSYIFKILDATPNYLEYEIIDDEY